MIARLKSRRLLIPALAALAGVSCGWLAMLLLDNGLNRSPTPTPADSRQDIPAAGLVEGQPLPPGLQLGLLDGSELALESLRGRPLLINVWASWCAPCVEEMPELAAFAAQQGGNGVQVIGLALDTPEAVHAFLERIPVPYPIAIDSPGPADASVLLGNERGLLPYTVLIDADGILRKRKLGPFSHGEIAGWANAGN